MFIEVYNETDRDVLISSGYKLLRVVNMSSGCKYMFANNNVGEMKFENTKVRATITNALTF